MNQKPRKKEDLLLPPLILTKVIQSGYCSALADQPGHKMLTVVLTLSASIRPKPLSRFDTETQIGRYVLSADTVTDTKTTF